MTVITVTVISFTPVIILDLVLKTRKFVYVRKYHSKFLKNMKILLFYLQIVEEHLLSNVMSTIQNIKLF
jgi:hypothetical protein